MDAEPVEDALVDRLEIGPDAEDSPFAVRGRLAGAPANVRPVLEAFVTVVHPDEARFLIDGGRQGDSRATDGRAFAMPAVTGHDGVVLEVGAGRAVVISEAAFARLLDRWEAALSG